MIYANIINYINMFYINFFKILLKNFNINKISIYQRSLYTEVLILNHDFDISRVDCIGKREYKRDGMCERGR